MNTHPPGGTPPPQTPTPTPKRVTSHVSGKKLEAENLAENYYLKLPHAKELKKVPIEEVARIAAMLVREGGLSSDENNPLLVATAKAFELLEIASYGRHGLIHKGSYAAGLAEFVESAKSREEISESIASIPEWEWKYDEQGQRLPVPLDKGLALVFPMPGVKTSEAIDRRMTRLEAFMIDRYRVAKPEQDEQERLSEVRERIAEWKRDGVPPKLFDQWRVNFPEWWQRDLSETRTEVGEKGQQAKTEKKGKQGRVKSKDDKRLGARPPVLKPPEETLGT